MTDASPKEAIDEIINAAFKAGADKRGFTGVSIEVDPLTKAKALRITMNLTDVPLGVALEYVAGYLSGHILANSKGIVIINTSGASKHAMLRLSPKVRKAFGLQETPSSKEIRQALTAASFKLDPNDEIIVSSEGEFARLRLSIENAKNLEALVELIEQGLSLNLARDK